MPTSKLALAWWWLFVLSNFASFGAIPSQPVKSQTAAEVGKSFTSAYRVGQLADGVAVLAALAAVLVVWRLSNRQTVAAALWGDQALADKEEPWDPGPSDLGPADPIVPLPRPVEAAVGITVDEVASAVAGDAAGGTKGLVTRGLTLSPLGIALSAVAIVAVLAGSVLGTFLLIHRSGNPNGDDAAEPASLASTVRALDTGVVFSVVLHCDQYNNNNDGKITDVTGDACKSWFTDRNGRPVLNGTNQRYELGIRPSSGEEYGITIPTSLELRPDGTRAWTSAPIPSVGDRWPPGAGVPSSATRTAAPSAVLQPTRVPPTVTPTPVRDYLGELRQRIKEVADADTEVMAALGGDKGRPYSWTEAQFNAKYRAAVGRSVMAYTNLTSTAESIPAAVYDAYCTSAIRDWSRQASQYWVLLAKALAANDVTTWNTAVDMQPGLANLQKRAAQLCPNL